MLRYAKNIPVTAQLEPSSNIMGVLKGEISLDFEASLVHFTEDDVELFSVAIELVESNAQWLVEWQVPWGLANRKRYPLRSLTKTLLKVSSDLFRGC